MTLIDPSDRELAVCYPQLIQENQCYQHETGVKIKQNLSTNEIVFFIDKTYFSNINGIWTCRHGTYGNTAYVTVNVCETCG